MKPSHLKFPQVDQKNFIQDGVWYISDRSYEEKSSTVFSDWSQGNIFSATQPICIEYCSGNGAWIASKALENPLQNWVAIERKFSRVRKIWSKVKNRQLSNLFTICGEGYIATHNYFPTDSVDAVYVNFPDPWPKSRHAKHRLIQPAFVQEVLRILKVGGTFTLVTDAAEYSAQMIQVIRDFARFSSFFPDPFYAIEYPGYGSSYFENLWREKGKTIRYHIFLKISGEG
jgi:tRNA (guanine-N7-)-methyltransferase